MRHTALLLVLVACGSDDPAPTVSIVSATPETLVPSSDARDDLTIVVHYTDDDADLGGGIATIHDCRADRLAVSLAIPPIASDQGIRAHVPIAGALSLVVADIGAVTPAAAAPAVCDELGTPDPTPGSAIFCVVLTDAAGHDGPGDCTQTIAIE